MCSNCFSSEYEKFENQKEFDKLSHDIKDKLNNNTLKELCYFSGTNDKPLIKILGIGFGVKEKGEEHYYLYECKYCNTKWKLSLPENAYRGFFLKVIE
ncbi:MAG: hypothetical protein A2046_07885 [Bacteroidetes bacterium GWA2_30_7]|nr:MAG: hypothetical protein A2046_07885 [Bacteroidetes bacterium GWA2_30_7]